MSLRGWSGCDSDTAGAWFRRVFRLALSRLSRLTGQIVGRERRFQVLENDVPAFRFGSASDSQAVKLTAFNLTSRLRVRVADPPRPAVGRPRIVLRDP